MKKKKRIEWSECVPFTLDDNIMDLMEWNGLLCTNIHRKAFKNFFFLVYILTFFIPPYVCHDVNVLFSSGDWIITTISGHIVLYISNMYVYIPNVRNVIKKIPLQERKRTELKKKFQYTIFFLSLSLHVYLNVYLSKEIWQTTDDIRT